MKKRKLEDISCIVIHHTAKDWHWIKYIKSLHVKSFGWEDIGYHYLIGNGIKTSLGKVYQGREECLIGAHVKDHNEYTLGVALIGDYDKSEVPNKQMHSLLALVTDLAKKYSVKPENIKGHKEFPGVIKTCPGKNVDLELIRAEVKTRLEEI